MEQVQCIYGNFFAFSSMDVNGATNFPNCGCMCDKSACLVKRINVSVSEGLPLLTEQHVCIKRCFKQFCFGHIFKCEHTPCTPRMAFALIYHFRAQKGHTLDFFVGHQRPQECAFATEEQKGSITLSKVETQ